MAERLEIGHGVTIEMVTDTRDRFVGLLWRHTCRMGLDPDGGSRVISIYFDRPWNRQDANLSGRKLFEVTSWEPLSLPESLLCHHCGIHGYIRDGKWLPVDSVAR